MSQAPHMRQVKASAGSGKTHDITGRFIDYLANINICEHKPSCVLKHDANTGSWADILAITFTNAAASEMKERVLERLKKIALGKEVIQGITPATAEAWVNTILRQYGSLNIRTIDSLLHRIVRTAALDLGLPPDFETSFTTDETLEPIFDAMLERAWQKDEKIEKMLRAICYSLFLRDNSRGFATGTRITDAIRPVLEQILTEKLPELSPRQDIEKAYEHLEHNFNELCSLLLDFIDKENLQIKKNVRETLVACTRGDKKARKSSLLNKSGLSELLYAKYKDSASDAAQNTYYKLSQAAHIFATDGHILKKALEWLPFVQFAKLLAKDVSHFQLQEHKVPAASIPLLAKKILNLEYGAVSTALCRLGSGINHILLDEFQDTSLEQWEALRPLAAEALSCGGSLTWVGDIKQAIYGWRGGDSSLFDALCQEQELTCMVNDIKMEHLPTNWRSREQVVHANNKLFSPFGNIDTAQSVLGAILSKDFPEHILKVAAQKLCHAFCDVNQKVKPDNYAGGLVTIEEISADNSNELTEAVKSKLYEYMQDLCERRAYSDITILTRSNSGAAQVAQWLMSWEIPVITENSLLLNTHPLIQESIAFLHFLNTSHDDLNFWTVLSGSILSPYLGKKNYSPSLDELHDWLLKQSNSTNQTTLSFEFEKQWPDFWEDIFAPFYNTSQLISPYDAMQEWYRILKVHENFTESQVFLRRFLEVLHGAAERGYATLSTFLDYWTKHGSDEKAPMPSKINAVQVMTIHKSKGLQFKVVILPWTSFNLQNNNPPPVHHKVQGLNVLAPRCSQMGDIYYKNQAEQALEAINVLYVACTRAEEELHIFHTHTKTLLRMQNLACGIKMLLPILNMQLPVKLGFSIEIEDEKPQQNQHPKRDLPAKEQQSTISHISRPMEWLPSLKLFRNPLEDLIYSPRLRGLLTHHCLEQFQSTGDAKSDAKRAVKLGLRTFTLPITQTKTLYHELVQALTWYATLPQIQEWTQYGIPEQSIMDRDGMVYRVDLLLTPYDGYGYRVIEFKTGLEDDKHIKQLHNYIKLFNEVSSINQEAIVSCEGVLIYLDLQKCKMVTAESCSEFIDLPIWNKAER